MRMKVAFVGLFGLLLAGYLIGHVGFGSVFSAVLAIGWPGFALLCLYGLAVFALLASAWRVLVAGEAARGWRTFLWARLVRDSAAETLPFSQIGGFVIGARAAILDGLTPPVAAASMIADITTEMVAQLVFLCLGVALLGAQMRTAPGMPPTGWLLTGILLAAIAAAAFYAVQRYGGGKIRDFSARFLPPLTEHAEALTFELQSIYRAPGRIAASFLFHLAGWIASGAAAWIALRLMGASISLGSVIAIESLVYGIRSIGFAVPNAFGVQEGAYVVLAPALGIGPEIGLAVSLLKRARDITIGVPVLLLWQARESRRIATQSIR